MLSALQTARTALKCRVRICIVCGPGYTSDSARASETNALVGPDTHRCGIAGKPNHDTVLPAHALVYQLVLPCANVVVHTRFVRHSLYPAILLPQCRLRCIAAVSSSAAAARLSKPKTPRSETSWRTGD